MLLNRSKTMTRLVMLACLFCLASATAMASHFRYGNVTYSPVLNASGNPTGTVRFKIQEGWRRSAFGAPVVGSIVSTDTFNFGDGTSAAKNLTVTSIDTATDSFVGEVTLTHTYTGSGPYTAFYSGCCRISTLSGGQNDQSWNYQTLVRPFLNNNSPTSSLPTIVSMVQSTSASFTVLGTDLERDPLRYRIAAPSETGGVPALSGVAVNPNTGLVTWNTSGRAVGSLWTVQFVIEDYVDANGNSSLDSGELIKSSTPVDIIIKIVANTGTAPVCLINGQSTAQSFSIAPGTNLTFPVRGTDSDPDPNNGNQPTTPVTLTVVGLPPAATMNPALPYTAPSQPVVAGGAFAQSTFSWTPTAADGGTRTITFIATDNTGRQTANTVSIFVETNKPPTINNCPIPAVTVTATSAAGASVNVPVVVQDPNGDPLTIQWTVNGVAQTPITVTNTFNPHQVNLTAFMPVGSHNVALTASDPKGLSASCSTTANVLPGAPTAGDDVYATNEDAPLSVGVSGVLANDTDMAGAPLAAQPVTPPSHGILSLSPNGSFLYTPNANFNGADSFTYKVSNGTLESAPATVNISVAPVNDAPTAACQNVTRTADGTGHAAVSAGEVNNGSSDIENDTLTFALSPAGPFPAGTTPVTLTATDPGGAAGSCAASVMVIDVTPPTIGGMPPNMTVEATGPNGAAAAWPAPTATDNVDGTDAVTCAPVPGSTFAIGTTTVTCSATDAAGNSSSAGFTITVKDATAPAITGLPGMGQSFDWFNVSTNGATPSARIGHRMVYDPVRHKVILFGGRAPNAPHVGNYVSATHMNDVWELDTASNTWTDVTPATGEMPVGRSDFGMAYDLARNKVVIYGGEIDGWQAEDTWEWDPATHTWAAKTAASGLVYGGMLGSAMAYDPNRHQVILFGGHAYYNWGEAGTWAWDGNNWTNITPTSYPPPRFLPAMATDMARSKVVMFGGQNPNSLNDTWEWDGSAWTQVALSGSGPSARSNAGMAFDVARHVTVLFGGGQGGDHNDTWEWDGAAWKLAHPPTTPSARATSMVYDDSQSRLLFFSGVAQADTWLSRPISSITAEATSPNGAPVSWSSPTGTDAVDGSVPVTCAPASGSSFPLGVTIVNCTSTDSHGNNGQASFNVEVVDTTSPALQVPADFNTPATGASGAPVNFTATATDIVDGAVTPSCQPPSGSTFPIATTPVQCSATDAHGNTSHASFNVTVAKAATTTSLTSSVPSSTYGDSITFTATVSSAGAAPDAGETVEFFDGATSLGTVALGGGAGTINISSLVAGAHIITAHYGGDGALEPSVSAPLSFNVAKAQPTISWANPADITYGTALSAAQLNATADVPGTFIYTPAAGALLGAGGGQTLSVTFTPADTANYDTASKSVNIDVARAALVVKADDKTKTYGEAAVAFTVSYAGFVNGDDEHDLAGVLAFDFADSAATAAGSYTVTPSGLSSPNYSVSYAAGTLSVGKAALSVTAADAERFYGEANPALTGTLSGVKNGDPVTASYSTEATQTSVAGSYAVVPALADPAGKLGNYSVTETPGTLTVKKVLLTVTADDKQKVYGQPNPAFTASYSGFVLGEGPAALGGTLSFATQATDASDVGSYAVTPSGLSSQNYTIKFVNGALEVTKAALTVTANDASKFLGAPNPAFSVTYSGFVLGQGAGVLGGTLSFATPATQSSPAGSYPVTPSGLTSNNYAVTFKDGVLRVGYNVCVLFDQTKSAQSGSTIPVKLQLCDAAGANVSSPSVAVKATDVLMISTQAPENLAYSGNSNPDFNFRYDPGLGGTGGYIFNLSTKGYPTGTFRLSYTVGGDPTPHDVQFSVR